MRPRAIGAAGAIAGRGCSIVATCAALALRRRNRHYFGRQHWIILLEGKGARMNSIKRFYVRIRESSSGQTMTEYVLIVTAVAVIVYAGYQGLGAETSASVALTSNLL